MTEVIGKRRQAVLVVLAVLASSLAEAHAARPAGPESHPAEALYTRLGSVGLDPTRVYKLRDAQLDRLGFHLTLEDGVIGFTEDVLGHVTGAFFEGEGEVLVVPPDRAERASLALFTGAAVLEEKFNSGYFRFNDDTYEELKPFLRPAGEVPGFLARCGPAAVRLASTDSLRLLLTFARLLPEAAGTPQIQLQASDRMLHARLQGVQLGGFDLFYDSLADEQVEILQLAHAHEANYADVWMSFNPRSGKPNKETPHTDHAPSQVPRREGFEIPQYKIKAQITPPLRLDGDATLEVHVVGDGQRALLFELSRYLRIASVEEDGKPVEFIHNPALEGSQLERKGDDLVAVVFPRTLQVGERISLKFIYGGEVLSEEANGLLYVGARGTWYPNRGLRVANFDLEFSYPAPWTLLATGKRMTPTSPTGDGHSVPGKSSDPAVGNPAPAPEIQHARWISERPLPVAGFNLGRYVKATALAGSVSVEAYATREVERSFPQTKRDPILVPTPSSPGAPNPSVEFHRTPSPARNVQEVADKAAEAVRFFSHHFGAYPYSSLALTQIPGPTSQGWPGLVFLSSYAFLSEEERAGLNFRPADAQLASLTPVHETAHQWWGDQVSWASYRDQWISEGLANYCALMVLETKDPDAFRMVMNKYRDDLLEKKDGRPTWEAGPVTLGQRLNSSRFPTGYEAISYGRGTWLFHMLRQMLRDAEKIDGARSKLSGSGTASDDPSFDEAAKEDELFMRILRQVQQKYSGQRISTRQLLHEFEEHWPHPLWFEGKPALDWFWDSWIQGSTVPLIQIKNTRIVHQRDENWVTGLILQREAPADLVTLVPLYAAASGKIPLLLGRVFADGPETSFRLRVPPGTTEILLDPERTLLRMR